MFNTTNIVPHPHACSYSEYMNTWLYENSTNIKRRLVSPYFQDAIPRASGCASKKEEKLTVNYNNDSPGLQNYVYSNLEPASRTNHKTWDPAGIKPSPIEFVSHPRVPQPCQGLWSIAVASEPQQLLYSSPESEEWNVHHGNQLTPGWSKENEEKWFNSQAGKTSEILRSFGYPIVSCGKTQPLLYYVNK